MYKKLHSTTDFWPLSLNTGLSHTCPIFDLCYLTFEDPNDIIQQTIMNFQGFYKLVWRH